ncbi:oligosaccharide flippase family protein [Algoriphagus aestuariicola]|uniref:Oligosaccharide flippase family protein n=1 Tax=Algoriphagus aestuariicola TaxID=1852016 RepID=A0ABS3BY22_9BACT|nr:oligosaccharide flippase family protein [Algoriphagus aestuariicola]MBN7803211.1 oligosaccharide flippase family protein [Algoriphagus aestuariicola]
MDLKKVFGNKVVKNFSYLTLGSIVSQLLMLLTVIKITNELSPLDYGTYSFIIAQGMLLIAISELGTKSIIIRTLAREPEKSNDLIVNGIKLRLITISATIGLYFIYNHFLGTLNSAQILLLGGYSLSTSLFYLLEHVFIGYQKMFFPSIVKSGMNFLYFLIVTLIPTHLFSIDILVISYIIITIIQTLSYFILLKKSKLIVGKTTTFLNSSKQLIIESWPYFTLMLLSLPMLHLSNNLLDINSDKEQVGYFNLAKKLMGPVQLVITFSLTAIFPNISAMFLQNRKRFRGLISNGMSFFIGLTALFCFSFTLFSKDIILLVFSEKYLPAIKVIQFQVWYLFLNGINHFITVIFGASNREKLITKVALVNLLISAPFLYIGSLYGALGISLGFVISAVIYEFYIWHQFKKQLNIKISEEKLTWLLSLLLFMISYSMSDASIYYKVILAVGFSGTYIAFAYKKVRSLSMVKT